MRREKDISSLKEGDQTKVQRDKRHGFVRDYTLKHKVEVIWDLNPDAIRDKMFKLRVDDLEVIIDAEELLRYLRWV